jgi:hypothetical protein
MPKILPDKAAILSHIEVDEETGCWLWTGRTDDDGYGIIYLHTLRPDGTRSRGTSRYSAHKVAWEVWNGPMPEGLTDLDHLCRTRRCCRPDIADLEKLAQVLGTPFMALTSHRINPYVLDTDYLSALLTLGQHLEPVTHRENVRRSDSPAGINARRTHCPEGHEYTERKGTDVYPWRYCPTCKNAQRRAGSPTPDLSK